MEDLASETARNILLSHHSLSHRNAKLIECSLKAVNNGFRTGFIWDIGSPVTLTQVKDIVDQLKLANILNENIIIINIKDDICVLNKKTFLEFRIAPIFIDVSENVSSPQILSVDTNEHLMEMVTLITNQIAETTCNPLSLKIDEEIYCIPSVLGILAGYPIVYWYDPVLSKERHCIAEVDLVVYKILDGNCAVYSFSVPKTLSEEQIVLDKISLWERELKHYKNYRVERSIQHANNSINL